MQLRPQQQGQMSVGAERVVADQHVAIAQVRVHLHRLTHVAGAQRRGPDVQQQSGLSVEQHEQMRYRKTATGGLSTGLAERLLQLWRVGHRERRAVHVKHPVPVPQVIGLRRMRQRPFDRPRQHRLIKRKRQTRAGLAVRRGRERRAGGVAAAREVAHLAARHVPLQHLLHEQRQRRGRIQLTVAPVVVVVVDMSAGRLVVLGRIWNAVPPFGI